mmetsp:Transcript_4962/g.11927  ORF Transcript_4962/g.11927 Transcript_4962/m.11927 type:complete len:781 (-) Transcript_4962:518-2860(-)
MAVREAPHLEGEAEGGHHHDHRVDHRRARPEAQRLPVGERDAGGLQRPERDEEDQGDVDHRLLDPYEEYPSREQLASSNAGAVGKRLVLERTRLERLVEDGDDEDWRGGEGDVVRCVRPEVEELVRGEPGEEAVVEHRQGHHRGLVEDVQGHDRDPVVEPHPVLEEKRVEEAELPYCEVGGLGRRGALLTHDPDPDVRLLDHRLVVASVADREHAGALPLLDLPDDEGLLPRRAAARDHRLAEGGQVEEPLAEVGPGPDGVLPIALFVSALEEDLAERRRMSALNDHRHGAVLQVVDLSSAVEAGLDVRHDSVEERHLEGLHRLEELLPVDLPGPPAVVLREEVVDGLLEAGLPVLQLALARVLQDEHERQHLPLVDEPGAVGVERVEEPLELPLVLRERVPPPRDLDQAVLVELARALDQDRRRLLRLPLDRGDHVRLDEVARHGDVLRRLALVAGQHPHLDAAGEEVADALGDERLQAILYRGGSEEAEARAQLDVAVDAVPPRLEDALRPLAELVVALAAPPLGVVRPELADLVVLFPEASPPGEGLVLRLSHDESPEAVVCHLDEDRVELLERLLVLLVEEGDHARVRSLAHDPHALPLRVRVDDRHALADGVEGEDRLDEQHLLLAGRVDLDAHGRALTPEETVAHKLRELAQGELVGGGALVGDRPLMPPRAALLLRLLLRLLLVLVLALALVLALVLVLAPRPPPRPRPSFLAENGKAKRKRKQKESEPSCESQEDSPAKKGSSQIQVSFCEKAVEKETKTKASQISDGEERN